MGVLRRIITIHWSLTLLLMGIFGLTFSLMLVNLIYLFQANFRVITQHGQRILFEGALQQLVELVACGYVAVIAYVLFKACEHELVDQIMHRSRVRKTGEDPEVELSAERLRSGSRCGPKASRL